MLLCKINLNIVYCVVIVGLQQMKYFGPLKIYFSPYSLTESYCHKIIAHPDPNPLSLFEKNEHSIYGEYIRAVL